LSRSCWIPVPDSIVIRSARVASGTTGSFLDLPGADERRREEGPSPLMPP
jgi:hypothetical protein